MHARRSGVAVVTNIEERNEKKRRLLPWTERMAQVWRQQKLDIRREEAARSSVDEAGGEVGGGRLGGAGGAHAAAAVSA